MPTFVKGERYSRPALKALAGLARTAKGGNWDTGIVKNGDAFFIFANVGTEGRTGHDYKNRWEGKNFRWYHKLASHLGWRSVQELLESQRAVHIFWRSSNKHPFEYAGTGKPLEVVDTSPVEILWAFVSTVPEASIDSPEQVRHFDYQEGSVRQILVNAYERNAAARQACIDHYGTRCSVCRLSFEERYGAAGAGFIHVHHTVPLSTLGPEYRVDPLRDLRPVCPNCHAMLHRKTPPFSVEELRLLLQTDSPQ